MKVVWNCNIFKLLMLLQVCQSNFVMGTCILFHSHVVWIAALLDMTLPPICVAKLAIFEFPCASLCLYLIPITGVHAKKQGEELSENNGDEDEGIFLGERRRCMVSFFYLLPSIMGYVWLFLLDYHQPLLSIKATCF